jgi:hypothetical protein
VELVGRLFVSPASMPFVVGSPDHAAAVAALERVDCGPPIDYAAADVLGAERRRHAGGIVSTSAPVDGKFLKFIPAGGRALFHNLFHVYRRDAFLPAADRPRALVDAELLYGYLCLAVRMPFIHGRAPTIDEFLSAPELAALADALAWLLRHGNADVRIPNVVVQHDAAGRVSNAYLVDYDVAVSKFATRYRYRWASHASSRRAGAGSTRVKAP